MKQFEDDDDEIRVGDSETPPVLPASSDRPDPMTSPIQCNRFRGASCPNLALLGGLDNLDWVQNSVEKISPASEQLMSYSVWLSKEVVQLASAAGEAVNQLIAETAHERTKLNQSFRRDQPDALAPRPDPMPYRSTRQLSQRSYHENFEEQEPSSTQPPKVSEFRLFARALAKKVINTAFDAADHFGKKPRNSRESLQTRRECDDDEEPCFEDYDYDAARMTQYSSE